MTIQRMLEKEIEERVVTWAKKNGFLAPKVKFADRGYPDRLFLSPYGHTIFIEFKIAGRGPDALQQYRINELQRRNIPAFCCDTLVGAINILKAALEPPQLPGAGDQANAEPVSSRVISGPWTGKDVDGPRYDKDSEGEETDQQGADRSSPSPDV